VITLTLQEIAVDDLAVARESQYSVRCSWADFSAAVIAKFKAGNAAFAFTWKSGDARPAILNI